MKADISQQDWIDRANKVLPAGGFGNFDPGVVVREGKGARVWDEDGKEYIDYLIGSGPMLLGHGHPEVVEASAEQLAKGEVKGYPYPLNPGGGARKIGYPYRFDALTANGCLGDATHATREQGETMIAACLDRAAEFLAEYIGE